VAGGAAAQAAHTADTSATDRARTAEVPVRGVRSIGLVMHLTLCASRSLPPEERLELRARLVRRGTVVRPPGTLGRTEIIAEIGALLVLDFLGNRLAAALRHGGVVELAHAADVQLRPARPALVGAPQRQRELGQRCAAF